jgi:outer membrane lipoprotein SlyB
MKKYLAIAALFISTIANAQFGGTDYNSNDVRRAMPAQTGVVIDVVSSEIDVQASGVSRTVGAAAAGLACGVGTQNMSNWSARAAVMGLCGLAGERAGAAFGNETRKASTLIVRLDGANVIAVAQEDPNIHIGSRVYVLSNGGATRVVLASSAVSYTRQ